MQNNTPNYPQVTNKPIACTHCGAYVNGRQISTPQGDQIKWICGRCNNLVKIGRV